MFILGGSTWGSPVGTGSVGVRWLFVQFSLQVVSKPGGIHPDFRLVGCEQVPGTNEYDFILDVGNGRLVKLDILTGEPRKK